MSFENLKINKSILKAIRELDLEEPTEIQESTFSAIKSGRDVLGVAPTGTGKTYAYLIPLLNLWKFSKEPFAQFLILTPTRELVQQVAGEIEKLTEYMNLVTVGVYGEVNIKRHAAEVEQGVDVVVGTPGRVFDLIMRGSLNQKRIKKVVIDEFDLMLDLGFRPQLTRILDVLPKKRQHILFSATINDEVEDVLKTYDIYPEVIKAEIPHNRLVNIKQGYYFVKNFFTKINLLEILLKQDEVKKALIFISTKRKADLLEEYLSPRLQEPIGIIHSNKSQNKRFEALNAFRNGDTRILIASDLMSRGIDIDDISHVINFDLPETPEQYIHRIGRTGRQWQDGQTISMIKESEIEQQARIEKYMKYAIPQFELPDNLEESDRMLEEEQTRYRY